MTGKTPAEILAQLNVKVIRMELAKRPCYELRS